MNFDTTALVIIDMQHDFLDGSLAVAGGPALVPEIQKLITTLPWKHIVVTKDWHPKDHISFASNHEGCKPFETVSTSSPEDANEHKDQVLWPDHCVQGSEGAELPAELQKTLEESPATVKTVLKGYLSDREYYSAFQDVWALHKTELSTYLKDQGISSVVVVGVAFDYCVYNTSVDAAKFGFATTLIRDLTASVDPKNDADTEAKLASAGVFLMKADSILS